MQQLQALCVMFIPQHGQGAARPAWQPVLPALTRLIVHTEQPGTISLCGCSSLQYVEVSEGRRLALTASQALPQLTRLCLINPRDAKLPWPHMRGLRQLELWGENAAGLLEGAIHLTALRDLHLNCSSSFVLPAGACLAGVTRLVLANFDYEEASVVRLVLAGCNVACAQSGTLAAKARGCAVVC